MPFFTINPTNQLTHSIVDAKGGTKMTIRDAIEKIYSVDYKGEIQEFATALSQEHRTHQQKFWRNIQHLSLLYAKNCEQFGTDLRNEQAKKFCDEINKLDIPLPYI